MIEIFKALAEESRLHILVLLSQGEMCVCEIEECLRTTQSNASRHLTALKNAGILVSYKKAQWTYYKISQKFKEENQSLWVYLNHKFEELPIYKNDFEEYKKCKQKNLCNDASKKG